MLLAEELVQPGGPSAPVWAFLSTITLAIIGLIGAEFKSRREMRAKLDEAKETAAIAVESAQAAKANTDHVSNGFASGVYRKLDAIIEEQNLQGNALRKHIEWHLERDK